MDVDTRSDFEPWLLQAFRQICEAVAEVDLQSGRFRYVSKSGQASDHVDKEGEYAASFEQALAVKVLEKDRETVANTLSLSALRAACKSGIQQTRCHFRCYFYDGRQVWVESRALFGGQNAKKVYITCQNVGELEEERPYLVPDEYTIALRSIYDELYELNLSRDSYRIVYHTKGKYVTPAESGRLSSAVEEVSAKMIHPGDKQRFLQFFEVANIRETFAKGSESMMLEARKLWEDGEYHWSALTLLSAGEKQRGDEIYLCFIMDIGEKKRADEIAEQNRLLERQRMDNERYRIIVEQTGTIVFERNLDTGEQYCSESLPSVLAGRYDGRDVLRVWREDGVIDSEDLPAFENCLNSPGPDRPHAEATVRLLCASGQFMWYKISLSYTYSESGGMKRIIGTISNVDDAVKAEQALKYRAEYDMLTGVRNEQGFTARVQELLDGGGKNRCAILRVDINRFKFINELFGFEEGDRLLRYLARLLSEEFFPGDVCGRIGGDVFCVCTPVTDQNELVSRARAITGRLEQYKKGYKIIPSFGICIVDDPGVPVNLLCDRANLALHTVKGNLVHTWAFYDDALRAKQLDERTIENEMEQALYNREFEVYLQPKHDIRTGAVVGAEALVRWNHPREGLLMPGRFIPLFERNGFILPLDEYVWQEACRILSGWIAAGHTPVPISVNVSRIHVYNQGFGDRLLELVRHYGLPPHLLELEITESTFIEDTETLYETMQKLQREGFVFSMDDFGAGYSSLNMLKNAPVNVIKLDREFLNETVSTRRGRTVIQYTISMAKRLNLGVVAEGVETSEQAAFLLRAGCLIAQGFYFSKPLRVAEFEKRVFPQTV